MSGYMDSLLMQDLIAVSFGEDDFDDFEEASTLSTQMQMEDEPDEEEDEDEDAENQLYQQQQQAVSTSHTRENSFNLERIILPKTPCLTSYEKILQLPERTFRKYFHLNQETALRLVHMLLGYDLTRRMTIETHANALQNFLIAFHYFSTGEYDFTFEPEHMRCHSFNQLNQPLLVVKCIIINIAQIIAQQKRFLSFSKSTKIQRRLVESFEQNFGIKHTLGCIDCLHVSIAEPCKEPYKYVNRHKYKSLNVEAICDANLMFLSVRIFPGSNSDCFSFTKSPIRDNLYDILSKKCFDVKSINWLLSDLAYPIDTFLVTPYENPQHDYERAFNDLHMRVFDGTIKRALELVRTTFRCLLKHKQIDFEPKEASYIVRACFVLYNILLNQGDINFDLDVFEVDDMSECYTSFNMKNVKNCPIGEEARNLYAKTLVRNSFKS